MVRANTAYVLDPETTIFKPVELQVDLGIRPLYAIIGCRLLEVVRFDERHTLFVDEEGLQNGLTAFTIFEGFPQPIAGKIVLVGGDGSTPYTSPQKLQERKLSRYSVQITNGTTTAEEGTIGYDRPLRTWRIGVSRPGNRRMRPLVRRIS